MDIQTLRGTERLPCVNGKPAFVGGSGCYIAPVDRNGTFGLFVRVLGSLVGPYVVGSERDSADEVAAAYPNADRNGY
jgi:hypothetical protein